MKYIAFIFVLATFSAKAQLVSQSFESTALSSLTPLKFEKRTDTSIVFSNDAAREGTKSLRFEVDKNEPLFAQKHRAEGKVFLSPLPVTESKRDWEMDFSMYLPSIFTYDEDPIILSQFHNTLDVDAYGKPLENTGYCIGLRAVKDRFTVAIKWDTAKISKGEGGSGDTLFKAGDVMRDVWIDWKFIVKFRYDSKGSLEVWKRVNSNSDYDWELVCDYHGATRFNDTYLPYWKFGVYHPQLIHDGYHAHPYLYAYFDNVTVK